MNINQTNQPTFTQPNLHFSSDIDSWEKEKLGSNTSLTTGKLDANASNENGDYAFFTCSKETLKTDTYAFDCDAILINGNGDLGFTRKYSGKFNAYQRTYVLTDFKHDFSFIEMVIKKHLPKKVLQEAFGGAMPYIRSDTVMNLDIYVPDLETQEKISKLLSLIEKEICSQEILLTKLKNLKSALLLKMFPQNNNDTPDLRFSGFTLPWEQRKLGEITSLHARIGWQNLRTSEYLDSGDYMLITGTDFVDGFINYSTCHYVEKARYDQDKNIQIKNGSILITKDGTLGKVAVVNNLDMPATLNAGVFNVVIKDIRNSDNKYLYQYLKASFLMDYVNKKATGGTIKHLNQNILVDFPVFMPSKEEQKHIGTFFQSLDRAITLHQCKPFTHFFIITSILSKNFKQILVV